MAFSHLEYQQELFGNIYSSVLIQIALIDFKMSFLVCWNQDSHQSIKSLLSRLAPPPKLCPLTSHLTDILKKNLADCTVQQSTFWVCLLAFSFMWFFSCVLFVLFFFLFSNTSNLKKMYENSIKAFLFLELCECKLQGQCPITQEYFSVHFLQTRIFSYNTRKMRTLTREHYHHLIYTLHTSFTDRLNNVFSIQRVQSQIMCFTQQLSCLLQFRIVSQSFLP